MNRRSYQSCGSDTPLLGETIGQCLDRIAAEYPDNEVLVSIPRGLRFTYREFVQVVDRAAKAFLKLGIRRGDRVAIWSINNYEWVVTQFATARIGAVLVNVNPAYRTHELEYVLKRVPLRARSILIDSFKSSELSSTCSERGVPRGRNDVRGRPHRVLALPAPAQRDLHRPRAAPRHVHHVARSPSWVTSMDDIALERVRGAGPRPRRRHQHPVHVRHDGLPQGRAADAQQHPEQRLLRGLELLQSQARRPHLRAGALLPLLRHGDLATWARSRTARRS